MATGQKGGATINPLRTLTTGKKRDFFLFAPYMNSVASERNPVYLVTAIHCVNIYSSIHSSTIHTSRITGLVLVTIMHKGTFCYFLVFFFFHFVGHWDTDQSVPFPIFLVFPYFFTNDIMVQIREIRSLDENRGVYWGLVKDHNRSYFCGFLPWNPLVSKVNEKHSSTYVLAEMLMVMAESYNLMTVSQNLILKKTAKM